MAGAGVRRWWHSFDRFERPVETAAGPALLGSCSLLQLDDGFLKRDIFTHVFVRYAGLRARNKAPTVNRDVATPDVPRYSTSMKPAFCINPT
jgi:hypothetical protein